MNRIIKSCLVVIGLLTSSIVMAHPGHGTFNGHEFWHYVTSPMHIGLGLAAAVIMVVAYKFIKAQRRASSSK